MVATGLTALVAVIAAAVALVEFATNDKTTTTVVSRTQSAKAATPSTAIAAAPKLEDAKGIKFEPFKLVDPTLPAVPAGALKKFEVDVMQHVVQVAPDFAPTEVWTYVINGKAWPGTGASEPIVVNEGDTVAITFVNGGSKAMNVTMPHSIDFHSAEVAPNKYYIGKPGAGADQAKMAAESPDVIAFNGYANQYKAEPIPVKRGERIRMYVLNAGPSKWSAFHVIGTVFDRTVVESTVGRDSQTINLAPSQGGWAEFTLAQEGNFPFVTHSFGDMVRGAAGVLHMAKAPRLPEGAAPAKTTAATDGVGVTLGEMWVKTAVPTTKAGKVTFNVTNTGGTMHQFAIGADPLTLDGSEPAASAAIAKGAMLHAGDIGAEVRLSPCRGDGRDVTLVDRHCATRLWPLPESADASDPG
jgi:hypothetical protein